jgi:hypothetical protein
MKERKSIVKENNKDKVRIYKNLVYLQLQMKHL